MKPPTIRIVPFFTDATEARAGRAYYFRLVAGNFQIVAQSEGYTTKVKRDKAMRLLARAKLEVA